MNTVFIDANVIADWFFIKRVIKGQSASKTKEILDKYKKLKQAYDFMEFITEEPPEQKIKENSFLTSRLVFMEVISVLSDFVISEKMSVSGIVPLYWQRFKKDFLLDDNASSELEKDVIKLYKYLFEESKIHLSKEEKWDETDMRWYTYFISQLGLKTHDGFILNTAIKEQATHLVTMDMDLKDDKIDKIIKSTFNLSIVKPQALLLELKK